MTQEYEELSIHHQPFGPEGEKTYIPKPSFKMELEKSNNIQEYSKENKNEFGTFQPELEEKKRTGFSSFRRFLIYPSWCIPWPSVSRTLTFVLILLACWGIAYSWLGEDAVPPKGQFFCITILTLSAYIVGSIIDTYTPIPPLLAMLLLGILYRNVDIVEIKGQYTHISAALRKMALAIILVRAGLGLDPGALRKLGPMVARLAIFPAIVEIGCMICTSHFLLNLPWLWGALLGCVMAAISPAVVIPCLFALQDKGYGRSKGVPTLIIAAASFDDVIAISLFGIFLSILFSTGDMTMQIIQGPLALIIGIVFGLVWGFLARFLPERHDAHAATLRTFMIATGALLAIFGSEAIGFEGAGPLGCIILAFVACYGWRLYGWSDQNPVIDFFKLIWSIFQPILFSLIGTEVNLKVLDGNIVGLAIACIIIGLLLRIICSIFVAFGGIFNLKEKIFISIAWFPKATVQAALGPIALDLVRNTSNDPIEIDYASKVLIAAVLSILLTAPLGAMFITFFGPRLLTKEDNNPSPSTQENIEAGPSNLSHL